MDPKNSVIMRFQCIYISFKIGTLLFEQTGTLSGSQRHHNLCNVWHIPGIRTTRSDALPHTNQLQIRGEMLDNLLTSLAVVISYTSKYQEFFLKRPNAPVCVGFGRGIVLTLVTERFAFSRIAMKFFFSSALFKSWMIWWPNTGGEGGRRRASEEFEIVHRILIF